MYNLFRKTIVSLKFCCELIIFVIETVGIINTKKKKYCKTFVSDKNLPML